MVNANAQATASRNAIGKRRVRDAERRLHHAKRKRLLSVSREGLILAAIAVLFTGSAIRGLRVGVGGLSVHPYLLLAGPLFLFYLPQHLGRLPRAPTAFAMSFVAFWIMACLFGPGAASEIIKVSAAIATASLAYVLLRTESDYRWAICGVMLAAAIVGLRGLASGDQGVVGINPMDGIGNKNSFSLYGIPALAAGLTLATAPDCPRRMRWLLSACALIIVGTFFSTGNRGGWLAVGIIVAFTVIIRRGGRAMYLSVFLALGTVYILTNVTSTAVIDKRVNDTLEKGQSDEKRKELVISSIQIGFANPILGISPGHLRTELGRQHARIGKRGIETHNLYALLMGGAGIPATVLFLGWILSWFRAPRRQKGLREPAAVLVLQIGILFYLGIVSSEVMYAPMVFFTIAVSRARFDLHEAEIRKSALAKRRMAQQLWLERQQAARAEVSA